MSFVQEIVESIFSSKGIVFVIISSMKFTNFTLRTFTTVYAALLDDFKGSAIKHQMSLAKN